MAHTESVQRGQKPLTDQARANATCVAVMSLVHHDHPRTAETNFYKFFGQAQAVLLAVLILHRKCLSFSKDFSGMERFYTTFERHNQRISCDHCNAQGQAGENMLYFTLFLITASQLRHY